MLRPGAKSGSTVRGKQVRGNWSVALGGRRVGGAFKREPRSNSKIIR